METDKCLNCGKKLTNEEKHYYEYRCEICERENHDRIVAWRNGADDEMLDFMFGGLHKEYITFED